MHASGSQVSLDDLINSLNELGEKIGYSTKTYNLLAIILILKNDTDRALKIFESAINDLKLNEPEMEAQHLHIGNNDLAALLVNYIKCNTIKNGCGIGADFLRNDELNKKLFIYL